MNELLKIKTRSLKYLEFTVSFVFLIFYFVLAHSQLTVL